MTLAGFCRAARTRWAWRAAAAAATAALLVSGCGSGSAASGPAAPSSVNMSLPSTMPTSSSTPANDRDAAENAYTAFWATIDRIPSLPEGTWQSALRQVLTDPQLTFTLHAIEGQRWEGVNAYGTVIDHVTKVEINGDHATVHDCQDASHSGVTDATGQPKTVGIPKNPIAATLLRDANGKWKVSQITYPGGTC